MTLATDIKILAQHRRATFSRLIAAMKANPEAAARAMCAARGATGEFESDLRRAFFDVENELWRMATPVEETRPA